ncbi:MAG: hypothetical protein ACLP4W_21160, partial [Mycobacterium sp.]|uniref:hypothetical protein n=1 Tax=Mycobacterium sp. TaxID=1785 RepID=UPI003F9B9258
HVLGRANWWAPKPMARLHAWFGISEASTPEPTEAAMKKSGQRCAGRDRIDRRPLLATMTSEP